MQGPTEIWTRIVRFRVWSANHYTIGPDTVGSDLSVLYLHDDYIRREYLSNAEAEVLLWYRHQRNTNWKDNFRTVQRCVPINLWKFQMSLHW